MTKKGGSHTGSIPRKFRGSHATANPGRAPTPPGEPTSIKASTASVIAHALAGVVLVAFAWRLFAQAIRGMFATDECFHAYVSEVMLRDVRFPSVLSEFYSGFLYYYHPLLHIVGALWAAVSGLQALHALPAMLTGVALLLLWGRSNVVPAPAARWAALACVLSPTVASMGVRLYVEALSLLLFVLAALAFLSWDAGPRGRRAVRLGLCVGLALLAKQSGFFLTGFLVVMLLIELARRRSERARGLMLALAVAVVIALPWFVRNHVLFGSAFYPLGAPDVDLDLLQLHRKAFTTPPLEYLRGIPAALGPGLLVGALLGVASLLWRRRLEGRESLLVLGLAAAFATAFVPIASARHLNPLLPLIGLGGTWSLFEWVRTRRRVVLALDVILIAAAAYAVWRMPDYRKAADLPAYLSEAFIAARSHVPVDALVLSLWTYDTFYYTRRPATWPIAWGQRDRPIEMFRTRDPAVFRQALDRHGIQYILAPRDFSGQIEFNGSNYPTHFIECMIALLASGGLELLWGSEQIGLFRVTEGR